MHGWKLVDEFAVPARATETVGKYNFTVVADRPFGYPVRVDALFTTLPAVITVSYREVGAAAWKPLPQAALSSHVEPNEQKRQDLQRSLSRGWNTWHRASATAHVHLPSAFGFDVTIADPEMNATFSKGIVDRCAGADGCRVRPNIHTFNGSFTHFDQKVRDDLAISVKSAHAPEVNGTVVLLKANASSAAAAAVAQIELHVASRYYFDCAPRTDSGAVPCGEIAARELRGGSHGLLARPIGLQPVYLRAVGADVSAAAGDQPGLTLRMQEGAACLVATVGAEPPPQLSTLAACSQLVSGMEAKVEAEVATQYPRATVGENRDAVDAIRAVMGWNTMFDHRATVITPVSRSFGQMPFEMWLWDTYFSTLLAAESSRELAYSNLIEITRPTVAGNVPGFRTAVASVQDRSKPFVGAMVLEMLYSKFKDKWIVELLFDDLLMWTNWIRDKRIELPAGLVVLGSDNVAAGQSDHHQCTKTAVIWESGLDNSPLYDDTEVNWDYPPRHAGVPVGTSCRFHFYDAGMTGLYLSMLDSLANLAAEIDRPADASELRARHTKTAAALNTWLWNETMGIYANRRSRGDNGTSGRVSPFNFHPMISGAASEEQAREMAARWLLSDDGFCLTEANDEPTGHGKGAETNRTACGGGCDVRAGMDAAQPAKQVAAPKSHTTAAECCAACKALAACEVFVLSGQPKGGVYENCWLLADVDEMHANPERTLGCVRGGEPSKGSAKMGCKFGVPSIAHSQFGYTDQSYWRGRTWGPMNMLVYRGLSHPKYQGVAEVQTARKRLATASKRLLLGEWQRHHHVHEVSSPDLPVHARR